ncbi:MAG: C40 family peptidase [Ferruginibacter sp.]
MKHLFFVSVALGIFSGTSISGKAQTAVNTIRISDAGAPKNSDHFIEGIEVAAAKAAPAKVVRNMAAIENCSALQFKYAQLMNTEVENLGNFSLYNFIEDWWGTRYRYGGQTRAGVDCSAYSGALLNRVYGISTPRTARDMYAVATHIDREDLQEGDLVFFNTRGGVSHVGVYLGNGYFTHASVGNGVTISSLNENYYSRRFISGGRLKQPCEEATND